MNPARRTIDFSIDINALIRRICTDIMLLRWFATTGGRGVAVISAIAEARRGGDLRDGKVLDFLERHVSPTQ